MKKLILFIVGIICFGIFAQDGTFDNTFDVDGLAITDLYGYSDKGTSVGIQDDGKIVVFGFAGDNGNPYGFHALVRYMPDGSLDPSFGVDGKVTTFFDNQFYNFTSLHIQVDQKIVTSCPLYNTEGDFLLTRYMPNGDVDPTFGNNGNVISNYANDNLAATVMLPDGKFLAGGKTVVAGTENSILLTKYLPNGALDNSFGTNGIVTTFVNNATLNVFGLKAQSDGKILVPYIRDENSDPQVEIIRYLENGELDAGFGNGGVLSVNFIRVPRYATLVVKADGKFLMSIRPEKYFPPIITQFLTNGEVDTSFGVDGSIEVVNNSAVKLLLQSDGKILVGGNFLNFEEFFRMSRFNSNGSIDLSFGYQGTAGSYVFICKDIALQSDNKILAVGEESIVGADIVLARLNNSPLSVPEFEKQQINVYPNPSDGIFILENNFLSETDNSFRITDITGKILFTGILGGTQTQIDLSSLQSGIYFLKTTNRVFRLLKN